MSGFSRLRTMTGRSGRLRWRVSSAVGLAPPHWQALWQHSSPTVRYFSTQSYTINREESQSKETIQEMGPIGTMNGDKIREMRYLLMQHSKKQDFTSAQAAQNLLTKLVDEAIVQGRPIVNVALHNNCLDAWAKSGIKAAHQKASELLKKMWERNLAHPEICPAPNTISYHSVLDACARSSNRFCPEAVVRAEEIIKEMERLASDNPQGEVIPTTWSYNFLITAHANQASETYGASNSAEDWLRYLSKLNTQGGPGPDTRSFNIVLKAWKQCPENKGADRALELLHLMIKLFRAGHHEQISPDHWSFGNVIQAFADRNRPEEAEEVLQLALGFYLDDESVAKKLNIPEGGIDLRQCFNLAITGWAKSARTDAPEKADALMIDMRALNQETGFVITRPDIHTYTSCMEAVAKSGRETAPEMVESRLHSLLEQHRRSGHKATFPRPNAVCFDCAIRTWYQSQKPNRAEHMEALLNVSMDLAHRWRDDNLLPEPRTVNMCLKAWCQAGRGRDRALPLLNRMELVLRVDSGSYFPLIVALLDQAKENNYDFETAFAASVVLEKYQNQVNHLGVLKWQDSVRHHYIQVVKALARVGHPDAADRAYQILESMKGNNKKRAKPTTALYTSVLLAMARTPEERFTQRALAMFDHMMRLHYDESSKIKLDTSAFVAMLTYLANTKEKWAADRADSLLRTLLTMHRESRNDDKKLQPDYRCYDKCLQARARCGDLPGAVKALKGFVEDYREGRALDVPSELGIDVLHRCCIRANTSESHKLANAVVNIKERLQKEGNLRKHELMRIE